MALHWERRTTSAVNTTFQQLHLNVHQQGVAPLNGWAGFTQGGPICLIGCPGPAGTDFVLLQNEQAGARTDFLKILYQDWPGAMESWGSGNLPQEWTEASWNRNAVDTIPANTTDAWNFLTYFKPTTFTNEADAAVTTRAADYRGPDDLATPDGARRGNGLVRRRPRARPRPSDFFNEKEAAYTLDLDPAAGPQLRHGRGGEPALPALLQDPAVARSTAPATITLEGVTLTRNVGFKADVMPISRASMHQDLLWYSTLQDAAARDEPGRGQRRLAVRAVTFEAARFGSGARLDASGDSIQVPTSGNFDKARGRIGVLVPARLRQRRRRAPRHLRLLHGREQLLVPGEAHGQQPLLPHPGGRRRRTRSYAVLAANYSWRANEWVHLRISWDDTLPLSTQQRMHINDIEPLHINPAVDYDSTAPGRRRPSSDSATPMATPPSRPGVYDEIDIISATTVLANAGLVGTASEYLADPAPGEEPPAEFRGRGRPGARPLPVPVHHLEVPRPEHRPRHTRSGCRGRRPRVGVLGRQRLGQPRVGGRLHRPDELPHTERHGLLDGRSAGLGARTRSPEGWRSIGSASTSPRDPRTARPRWKASSDRTSCCCSTAATSRLDGQTFVINPPAPTAVRAPCRSRRRRGRRVGGSGVADGVGAGQPRLPRLPRPVGRRARGRG